MTHPMRKYLHGGSSYALVTGATDGIGRAVAFELASIGFNVVIHGRNPDKLETVKKEILALHSTRSILTLCCDGTKPIANWKSLLEPLLSKEGFKLTVLVNNLGLVGDCEYAEFEHYTDEDIAGTIQVNTVFPTQLTKNLLPTILRSGRPSLILNMSSAGIIHPVPFLPVYSGTKAYNVSWSKSLDAELKLLNHKVDCKVVLVGAVNSAANTTPVSFFVPSSESFARTLLHRVNTSSSMISGCWQHGLQFSLGSFTPSFVLDIFIKKTITAQLAERERSNLPGLRVSELEKIQESNKKRKSD